MNACTGCEGPSFLLDQHVSMEGLFNFKMELDVGFQGAILYTALALPRDLLIDPVGRHVD